MVYLINNNICIPTYSIPVCLGSGYRGGALNSRLPSFILYTYLVQCGSCYTTHKVNHKNANYEQF